MRCPVQTGEISEMLLAYCSRRLSPGAAVSLERHMETCPECRRLGEAQKAVWKALDVWEAEPVSPGFDRLLYAAIEAREKASWRSRLFATFSQRPVWPLASACVAVLAIVLLQSPPMVHRQPENSRVEAVDVETVESALEDLEMLRQFDALIQNRDPGEEATTL